MSLMDKQDMLELSRVITSSVIEALEARGVLTKVEQKIEKTAYQKTEQLLYYYPNFKRILEERDKEIKTLEECGVPRKSSSIVEYSPKGGTVQGIKTEEESVHDAIRSVQASVHTTVQAIALIDKCMESLKTDPYYCILEMRYFEGRTQEDIAEYLGCSQVTVSKNKNRLIKELSIKLFPDQAIREMMR